MEDERLCYMSATEMARTIARKKVSPVEIVDALFSRIHRLNPKLNAYCTLAEEQARREARLAEEAVMREAQTGILHGVPVAIKDLILTRGIRTTLGSKIYENFIPQEDEIVVKRLKAAGAIILGKTNTCEFGYKAVTDNFVFGPTRNPWNPELTPAGSSGGAAAAVASGLGPLAVGSDGGGSVRAPAGFCGVFGLKPSRGRIPIFPVPPGWENIYRRLLHLGPITRSVADAALMMEAMAGPDDRDPASLFEKKISYRRGLKKGISGLRVAWTANLGDSVVEPEIRDKLKTAVEGFAEFGCRVEEVKVDMPSMHVPYQALFAVDCAVALGDRLGKWREQMDRGLVRLIEIGQAVSGVDYSKAMRQTHLLWNSLQPYFADYHLLLTPTLPVRPFPIGIDWPRETAGKKTHPLNYLAFTYPFNLTGQPAASVPCGWTEDGLPVGLQIIGRPLGDGIVLQAAAAFEEARPWQGRRPPL
jgi:Asp-tRNA(Asn)/Glu-tRNA(Gln) amidotransferase A subunit family amidase